MCNGLDAEFALAVNNTKDLSCKLQQYIRKKASALPKDRENIIILREE
jgi:hypothetical protein